jgi:hypothetical protein
LRPVALIQQLWIEITSRPSVWFLPISPVLRRWTKLFRRGPNESIDHRQVERVRTQSQSIERTRQSTRRMLGGILRGKNANQRTAQTIGDDLSIIYYLGLDNERFWRRRTLETQRLSHEAEHFECSIGTWQRMP